MTDGTTITATLIGMSSTSPILDRWASFRHQPAGDPFVLELLTIAEIVVP